MMKGWLWMKIEKRILEGLNSLDQGDIEEAKGFLLDVEVALIQLAKPPLSSEEAEELARLERKIPQVVEALARGEIKEARAVLANLRDGLRLVVDHVLLSGEESEEEGD
jgi:hypothetical protein